MLIPPLVIDMATLVSTVALVVTVVVKLFPENVIDPPSITNLTDVAILAPELSYAFTANVEVTVEPEY